MATITVLVRTRKQQININIDENSTFLVFKELLSAKIDIDFNMIKLSFNPDGISQIFMLKGSRIINKTNITLRDLEISHGTRLYLIEDKVESKLEEVFLFYTERKQNQIFQ